MNPNSIEVSLDQFDGPLALLLHLIQRDEVQIKDLNINIVTQQYIDYLSKMHDFNFDVAGEYLYMAATLLYLKSKYCVTEQDQKIKTVGEKEFEIQSCTDLIKRLEQLERYRRLGEQLIKLPKKGEDIFVKNKVNRKQIANSILIPMELESLTGVMIDLIQREKRKYTVIKRDRLSIKEKLKSLTESLKKGMVENFFNLIDRNKGRDDVVITFISLLELARLKKLSVTQEKNYGDITVKVKENLGNFDVDTANGFDEEEGEEGEEQENVPPALPTTETSPIETTAH